MPYKVSYEEDGFLRELGVSPHEAQPLANNCTLVLVWHTQTYQRILKRNYVNVNIKELQHTNIPQIYPTNL